MSLPVAAFLCCRDHDLFAPVEEFAKSIVRFPADEAYWFNWRSSFQGEATIQVARVGNEAVISRRYPAST